MLYNVVTISSQVVASSFYYKIVNRFYKFVSNHPSILRIEFHVNATIVRQRCPKSPEMMDYIGEKDLDFKPCLERELCYFF
jgi:hypothetical protein